MFRMILRTSAEPMKPAPPVTSTVLTRSSPRAARKRAPGPSSARGGLDDTTGLLGARGGQIGVHHHLDEASKAHFRLPAEVAARLARVSQQQVHLGGAVVFRVDGHVLAPIEVQ